MATWVVGDVHGCYSTFKNLLKNEEIKEEDTIILIGDIIDRGPDSVKMLKWAMQNITDDGKYQMVCGNHEDNIIHDFKQVENRFNSGYFADNKNIKSLNDLDVITLDTHYDFTSYMYCKGYETVESVRPFIEWFAKLPLYKKITVTTPAGTEQKYVIAHAWYNEKMTRDDILWYRDVDSWSEKLDRYDYEGKDGEILIHGHTPTLCIYESKQKDVNEVLFRKNSINIDCGCVFKKYGGNLAAIRLEDKKVIYARKQIKIKD